MSHNKCHSEILVRYTIYRADTTGWTGVGMSTPLLPDGLSETGADLMSLREGMQLADLIPKSSSRHTYPTFRSETPLISNASSSPDQPEDLPAIISLHDAPSHTRLVSNFFCDTNFSAYSVH